LRARTFRRLWFAQLGSNIGTWMQTVAAQWFLVGHSNAATLVSLVQTASLLPVLFLSLPAGVLADVLDRRRLLLATSIVSSGCVALLAVLTAVGALNPVVLLVFTLLIGCASALTSPAWQAIQPDLVPRAQIPAAASLGSITVNAARAVGPALAGFLVAWLGAAPVFAINAVSFLGISAAVFVWRQPPRRSTQDRERMVEAIEAGVRYLRAAPGPRRIILRSVLFAGPGSALWALLPLAADQHLRLGAGGYGALLGVLGVGAIVGIVVLPPLRARASANIILAGSAVAFALGTVSIVVLPLAAVIPLLLLAGVGWIATLSTLNATMQLALPAWVRARGMAGYVLAFMGVQAVGSFVWGLIAQQAGLTLSLGISAALLVLAALSVAVVPLHAETGHFDRTPVSFWPTPTLMLEPQPTDGPVVVVIAYRVARENQEQFIEATKALELSRRRTGARNWRLYRDGADEDRFVEQFTVRSWGEHLRQHADRMTAADRDFQETVKALAGETPIEVTHLLPAR
jgi:MFS family permease